MLLRGSIHRFDLASVLQFLAQNTATGVVEVRDFEEYGFIYLEGGQVEGISLPITDEKLGSRLVRAGCLSEQQLAEALMEDSALSREQRKLKPLGQRLIELGYASEAKIREVMARQTMDQVFELAHWQNGEFLYDEPEQMPHFQVKIQGVPPRRRGRALSQDGQRRGQRGLLRVPRRGRLHGRHPEEAPQEGRLPVARDGCGARRRVRPSA